MQAPPQVAGINLLGAIYLLLVVMAVLLPMLSRRWAPPEHEDPDSGDGPDDGPPDVPPPPPGPSDGLPLPDAEPSGVRLAHSLTRAPPVSGAAVGDDEVGGDADDEPERQQVEAEGDVPIPARARPDLPYDVDDRATGEGVEAQLQRR
jgi:hypothetical protein